jgi:hypothetical protein
MDSDPEVRRFVAGPWSDPQAHRAFIEARTRGPYPEGMGYWAVCLRDPRPLRGLGAPDSDRCRRSGGRNRLADAPRRLGPRLRHGGGKARPRACLRAARLERGRGGHRPGQRRVPDGRREDRPHGGSTAAASRTIRDPVSRLRREAWCAKPMIAASVCASGRLSGKSPCLRRRREGVRRKSASARIRHVRGMRDMNPESASRPALGCVDEAVDQAGHNRSARSRRSRGFAPDFAPVSRM